MASIGRLGSMEDATVDRVALELQELEERFAQLRAALARVLGDSDADRH
jgi:hypothetical protein